MGRQELPRTARPAGCRREFRYDSGSEVARLADPSRSGAVGRFCRCTDEKNLQPCSFERAHFLIDERADMTVEVRRPRGSLLSAGSLHDVREARVVALVAPSGDAEPLHRGDDESVAGGGTEAAPFLHEMSGLVARCGADVVRLAGRFDRMVEGLPALGQVVVETRNSYASVERRGRYRSVKILGSTGLVLGGPIDLRLALDQWRSAFASVGGESCGLHFFDGREEKYKPPPDAKLAPPEEVAQAAIFALSRPAGIELREALVAPATESSWP